MKYRKVKRAETEKEKKMYMGFQLRNMKKVDNQKIQSQMG